MYLGTTPPPKKKNASRKPYLKKKTQKQCEIANSKI